LEAREVLRDPDKGLQVVAVVLKQLGLEGNSLSFIPRVSVLLVHE